MGLPPVVVHKHKTDVFQQTIAQKWRHTIYGHPVLLLHSFVGKGFLLHNPPIIQNPPSVLFEAMIHATQQHQQWKSLS